MQSYTVDVKTDDQDETYIELPQQVLDSLQLEVGDDIEWVPLGEGKFELRKAQKQKKHYVVRRSYIVDEYLLINEDCEEYAKDVAVCELDVGNAIVAAERIEHRSMAAICEAFNVKNYAEFVELVASRRRV